MDDQSRRMSDNGRRFCCRVVFMLVCFLPTSVILYFLVHRPGAEEWTRILQSELPIKVGIASVETPIPNRVVLRGVDVLPSDAGMFSGLNGFSTNEVIIDFGFAINEVHFVDPVEIEMDSLASLLNRIVLELDDKSLSNDRWRFTFNKVAVVDNRTGGSGLLLKPMSISLQRSNSSNASVPRLQARLLGATDDDDPASQLAIDFQKFEESNLLTVDARQCTLPATLIQKFLTNAPNIGRSSLFTGQIEFQTDIAGYTRGNVVGSLHNVHLDEFQVANDRINGMCDIKKLFCSIEDGRIESGQLQVTSDNPITVDRSLINQLENFGITVRQDLNEGRLSISQLELGVNFQNGNLLFSGKKGDVRSDGEMVQADCIAFQSQGGTLEAVAICNSQKSIPLISVAQLISENGVGNRTLEFLDHFSIPTRSASRAGDGLY